MSLSNRREHGYTKQDDEDTLSSGPVQFAHTKTLHELEDIKQHQSNSRFAAFAGAAAIFGMFITTRSVPQFLGQLAGRILLPFTALSNLSDLFFKWQEYQRKQAIEGQSNGFYSLVVDAVVAVGSLAAIAAAFLTTTLLAPILLVVSMAAKSAWELAMAAKDFYQVFKQPEFGSTLTQDRRNELLRNASAHLARGIVTSLLTVSIGLISFAGYAAFTYLGLAASGLGAAVEYRLKEENSNLGVVTLDKPTGMANSTYSIGDGLGLGHGFLLSPVNVVNAKHYQSTEAVQANRVASTNTSTISKSGALSAADDNFTYVRPARRR